MASKYTLAAAKTGSALAGAEAADAQLSNGALVYVRSDGSASAPTWGLYVSADRASEQLIATLSGFITSAPGPGLFALAVDASDNIVVGGPNAGGNGWQLARFIKGSGLAWTAGATAASGDLGVALAALRLHWVNTGGGTSTGGHLLMTLLAGTVSQWVTRDAVTLAAAAGSETRTGRQGGGGQMDSCQPTIGGPVWFTISGASGFAGAQPIYATVASDGTITSNTMTDAGSAGYVARSAQSWNETTQQARLVPLTATQVLLIGNSTTSGRWVAIAMDAANTIGSPTLSGAPTGMPLVADSGRRWDVYTDPQTTARAWVAALSTPASSATNVQAIACALSGSTLTWSTAATTLDTLAAASSATTTNLALRVCKTGKGRYVDFQASVQDAATPTYGTYGDYLLYNTAPGAATPSSPVSNAGVDRSQPIPLVWVFNDPDAGDTQLRADVRYRVPAVTSTWTTVANAATTSPTYSIPANTFAADAQVEWQVLPYDAANVAATSWSASAFFTARNPTATPSITSPTDAGTVNGVNFPVTWTAAAQDAYQVRRLANNAGAPADPAVPANVYFDSGAVEDAAARSRTVVYETNGRVEHTQVRVRANGLWSSWASVRDTVNYTPPAAPSFVMTPVASRAAVLPGTDAIDVAITQPAATGNQPAAASHNVLVDDGTVEGLRRVAVVNVGATWRHCTPVVGRDYAGGRVVIETVATTGATTRTSS